MKDLRIGSIKNIKYNDVTNDMEITITVTDNKFKKKILRDFSLDGKIMIEEKEIIYITNTKD